MSPILFLKSELAAAVARGVRQYVAIGARTLLPEILSADPIPDLQSFTLTEEQGSKQPATFVQTSFASEALGSALEKSSFDKNKAALFLWLEGAGYRTAEAVVASLSFIATLPSGSGVLFDYAAERSALGSFAHTTLDALASRISLTGGLVREYIDPQAVTAMLHSLGFHRIVDFAVPEQACSSSHLVSATV